MFRSVEGGASSGVTPSAKESVLMNSRLSFKHMAFHENQLGPSSEECEK